MNILAISAVRGTTIAIMILVSSVFSGNYFESNFNTKEDCPNVLDFNSWLSSNNKIQPISIIIELETAWADFLGTYDSEFVSDQYLNIFPNDTHLVEVWRTGLDTWYEAFSRYSSVEYSVGGTVVVQHNQTLARDINVDMSQSYIFQLRKQLQQLFEEELHTWDWNQVLSNGHSDNEYRQILATFINSDGTAIKVFFQEKGIMISGEYAQFFQGDKILSNNEINQFYLHQVNQGFSYGTSGCRVYYYDTANFESSINAEFLQYMADYISVIL